MENFTIEPIAHIHNNYKEKFGIPRQSNLTKTTLSTIIFEQKYRDDNSLRGLSEYSHIWLLWQFDKLNVNKDWSPTVRPPRLGGNTRVGVFATRSPYHPNGIGLSCVELVSIEKDEINGTVLKVRGADLLDKTPIVDIKPYLSFSDSIDNAKCGFAEKVFDYKLEVIIDKIFEATISKEELLELKEILSQDPRPSYQNDPERIYKMNYSDYEISFRVQDNFLYLTNIQIKGCKK